MFKKTLSDYAVEGSSSEDATSLLQSQLGFCVCGAPEDSLRYILRGLELIEEGSRDVAEDRAAHEAWLSAHFDRRMEHFGTYGAEYFFYYWCDKADLSNHGGSVPGWLTDEGKNLLALLREWSALETSC